MYWIENLRVIIESDFIISGYLLNIELMCVYKFIVDI